MKNGCSNVCHRPRSLPVRFCPDCGEIVNGDLPARQCRAAEHARRQQHQERYCVHCGEHLVAEQGKGGLDGVA